MTGASQRRKQRRLRSWWRHEQQSIAAALATSLHHSSRGQRKARAGEEESEVKYTAKFRTTPPPQPELFSLYEEPGGTRPVSLAEPGCRKSGFSGTLWSRSPTSLPWYRSSMYLCRWSFWAGCKTESCSKSRSRPLRTTRNRRSPCPRSPAQPDLLQTVEH